ncbi:hypothetical protein RCL1_009155 [Eukaryota sp. TZLM3-RCL]
MDDSSLIAPFEITNKVAPLVAENYSNIGLELNVSKCFLISNSGLSMEINDISTESTTFSNSNFRFLNVLFGAEERNS